MTIGMIPLGRNLTLAYVVRSMHYILWRYNFWLS